MSHKDELLCKFVTHFGLQKVASILGIGHYGVPQVRAMVDRLESLSKDAGHQKATLIKKNKEEASELRTTLSLLVHDLRESKQELQHIFRN